MSAVLQTVPRRELLLGCGNSRAKRIHFEHVPAQFENLTTLDADARCAPDVVHDLNVLPYPFDDCAFDEIHAYEVLEHCGRQGDWRYYFAQWSEFWRIMKPGAFFCATVPAWDSAWVWGDPGHTRIISRESLSYLDQDHYQQVGVTSASDYRDVWRGNFHIVAVDDPPEQFAFVLQAIK